MGKISMDFTDFMELTKNTDYELVYEVDTKTYSDNYTGYVFYIKHLDGLKTYLVNTNDFTIAFERYFAYIKGSLGFYQMYCKKLLEGNIIG